MNLALRIAAALFQVPADVFLSSVPMISPLPQSPGELAHRQAVDHLLDSDSDAWTRRLRNNGTFKTLDLSDENDAEQFAAHVVNSKMVQCDPCMNKNTQNGGTDIRIFDQETGEAVPRPSTYGEVTPLGARQLFYLMGMKGGISSKSTNCNGHENTHECNEIVFMDLGSGAGRLVMQAYMELPRLSRAIGIELAPTRHQQSKSAWEQLQEGALVLRRQSHRHINILGHLVAGGKGDNNVNADDYGFEDHNGNDGTVAIATLELVEGDFLENQEDLYAHATHIYISSLCFSDRMMFQLGLLLQSRALKLQCVATLRPFPRDFEKEGILTCITDDVVSKTFGLIHRQEYVEMTWTKHQRRGALVHIYSKPQLS